MREREEERGGINKEYIYVYERLYEGVYLLQFIIITKFCVRVCFVLLFFMYVYKCACLKC